MTATAYATGEEILRELVKNLEQSLEPLLYTVLAPSVFDVYLHPEDLDRLAGIIPQLLEEARRALDERLEALQRDARPSRLRRLPATARIDLADVLTIDFEVLPT